MVFRSILVFMQFSPIKFDEFKDIERFDYMKEWGFKS